MMSVHLLSLLLLAAPAPVQASPPGAAQANPIAVAAQATDRCMTTYAVKLLATGLGDDVLFTVASTMCQPVFEEFTVRIKTGLPKAQADDLLAKVNADRKGDYARLLKSIRDGRARRAQ